ncbi:MAG: hypothetical protein HOG15_07655 [Anaerolineae bacterium]|jgi:hypothetical protein|nr:hypothetical protein [Anaerolineae bacterium]
MKAKKVFRLLVLLLALFSSPFACMGAGSIIFALPSMDSIGFFHGEVRVENHSAESLYITPITTTYAEPRIITQALSLYYRDIPLKASASLNITYDTADFPLAGIAICREKGDCRLLEYTQQEKLTFKDFDALPPLDESWIAVIRSAPKYNFQLFIFAGFALMPFALLALWWHLRKQLERQE